MFISFTFNNSRSNSILLVSATSSDGIKTDFNDMAIKTNTYHEIRPGGQGPWEIELSGYYIGPKIKVTNMNDIISAFEGAAFVCSKAN